jgi:hypothetical protein
MKINKNISPQQFLPVLEAEIWGLLLPAQANLWIFTCAVSVSPAALSTV